MSYGKIINDSFQIFWKHKSLWVFGIIASLVGHGDYGFSVNYRESYPAGSPSSIPSPFGSFIADFLRNPIPYIIAFVSITIVVWVIFSLVGWLARGALIGMVNQIDQGGMTTMGSGWQIGRARVIPLFSISLILALPQFIILVAAVALTLPLWLPLFRYMAGSFAGGTPGTTELEELFRGGSPNFGFFLSFCGLICCAVLLSWGMGLLNTMAARSCVVESLGVIASLKRGWQIATRNIGYVLLNWLILFLTSAVYGFIAAIPALVLWIPTARALLHNSWTTLTIITAALTVIYVLAMSVGLGGILTSFNETLWTNLYKGFLAKETPFSSAA